MTYQVLAKQVNSDLYPDVAAAGTLSNALGQALAEIGSQLQTAGELPSLSYARVERGSRYCQMYIAANERLFMFDFWSKGVTYGKGSCSSLQDAAQAIHYWIAEEPNIAEMESRFRFFIPAEQGVAHEAGRIVDYQWDKLIHTWTSSEETTSEAMSPLPLIRAAKEHPELRQLFPFTSLHSLRFSRTTGWPFTNDCPFATPIGNGRFRAYPATDREGVGVPIGEGDADEVVAMLVANLPPNCGPAVDGTEDDLTE